MGNGLYVIGDQTYFISIDPSLAPTIENYLDEQVLLLKVKERIQYNIIW